MSEISALIRAHDGLARSLVRARGAAAVPELSALLDDPDWRARELAAACLGLISGSPPEAPLLRALDDETVQVRALALRGLVQCASPGAAPRVLAFAQQAPGGEERRVAAMILGYVGQDLDLEALRTVRDAEILVEVREGWTAALARLGDEAARRDFVSALHMARGPKLVQYLREYGLYLDHPWLLKPLRPLLDDETELVYPREADPASWLRACDMAIHLAGRLLAPPLSFAWNKPRFTVDERDEVKRRIDALPT